MKKLDTDKTFDLTHLFIKFIDKEYLDPFMKRGELHFESFDHFKKIDDGESGDINEGTISHYSINNEVSIRFLDSQNGETYKFNSPKMKINYQYKELQSFGLTSFYHTFPDKGIDFNKFDRETSINLDGHNDNIKYTGVLNKENIDSFKSFIKSDINKDKVPVVIVAQKFMSRILSKKIKIYYGPVNYYDEYDAEFFQEITNSKNIMTLFSKTNDYSHQKEFRIVYPQNVSKDYGKNIYLGNIEDFAFPLKKIEDLKQLYIWFE